MRTLLLTMSFAALVACETTVNTPVASTPELNDGIELVATQLNQDAGAQLSPQLTLIGASRSENALQIHLRVSQGLADNARGTSRAALADAVERRWRQSTCSDPRFKLLVDTGGRINTQFEDPIGRRLFEINIDHC